MNPKAQHTTSSAIRSPDGVQASFARGALASLLNRARLQSFPDPAGETPALPFFAPLSPIFRLLSPKRRAAAFTLLEVLVASAIMGIVMFVLVSTANTSLQLWRGTSEKMAVDREGRAGMALLAWDLQNIIQPTNNALRPKLDTNGNAPTPLRFLTLKPADYQNTNSDFGDVCYVEYRFESNALKRGFLGSNATWTHLSAGNMPPTNAIPESEFETLMTNMMQFRVWGYESGDVSIGYSGSNQLNFNQILRSIEYRAEVYDQKYMKLYKTSPALAEAQKYKSKKYYQAIQPVPPPVP